MWVPLTETGKSVYSFRGEIKSLTRHDKLRCLLDIEMTVDRQIHKLGVQG